VPESDGFSYEITMPDEMSGPAHDAKDALDELTSSIKKNEGALKEQKSAGHEANEGHKEAAGGAGFLSEALGGLKESLIPQVAIGEMVAQAVEKLGDVALEAAKKFAELVIEGTKFALKMSEFKENSEQAYAAVLGTAEEGEATFAAIDRLSRSVHMPAEKAHDLAKTLMLEGLTNQEQITSAITVVSDLHSVGLDQGAEKFQRVIERSLQEGHFALPKRGGIPGADLEQVYKTLGERLHIGVDEVKRQLAAGRIGVEEGISALEETFMKSKAHEIAKSKFDLSDVETDLSNSFHTMLQDVDASPLKQSLVDFVSIFDQGNASGQTMKEVLTDTFNTVIRWVSIAVDGFTVLALKGEASALDLEAAFYPEIVVLTKIEHAAEAAAKAILGIGTSADNSLVSSTIDKLLSLGGGGGVPDLSHMGDVHAPVVKREPAHADGGTVHEPPPGESFAAVKPGEMILPVGFASQMPNLSPANSNGGGTQVHVDVGGIHITASDREDMRRILESEIVDVFERVKIELGR